MKCGTGKTWKSSQRVKGARASRTPGKLKGPRCSLTSIGGMPRKYWTKSRSYKSLNYREYVEFCKSVNKGS